MRREGAGFSGRGPASIMNTGGCAKRRVQCAIVMRPWYDERWEVGDGRWEMDGVGRARDGSFKGEEFEEVWAVVRLLDGNEGSIECNAASVYSDCELAAGQVA